MNKRKNNNNKMNIDNSCNLFHQSINSYKMGPMMHRLLSLHYHMDQHNHYPTLPHLL